MLKLKWVLFVMAVFCPIVGHGYNDARVFVAPTCPVSGSGPEAVPIALAAAVLPKLIETTVDYTAAALKVASEKEDSVQTAATSTEFYSFDNGKINPSSAIGCVVVISGDFGEASQNADFGVFKPVRAAIEDLGLSGEPKLYLEANIGYSKDRSSFRLQPQTFYVKDFETGSWFRQDRDYVFTFSFFDPSKNDKSLFGSTNLSFTKIKKGDYIAFQLSKIKSGWMSLPSLSDSAVTKYNELEKAKEDYDKIIADNTVDAFMVDDKTPDNGSSPYIKASFQLCKEQRAANKMDPKVKVDDRCKSDSVSLAAKRVSLCSVSVSKLKKKIDDETDSFSKMTNLAPTNIQVSVTETRNPIKFLKFISDVANASKDDVKTALKNNIKIDADKEKSKKEKFDAEATNEEAIYKAEIEVQTAINTKNKLVTPTTEDLSIAEYNIKIAKVKANTAYRAANKPEPYSL